ncbi:KH domain-containing protein [Bdellovibrio sp. 22V]|nr:KH domain-containing protein [Bdellovibrio sp. 22V]WII71978.1 KH domain-containing protein [Bdellovibrio sp. 22V]
MDQAAKKIGVIRSRGLRKSENPHEKHEALRDIIAAVLENIVSKPESTQVTYRLGDKTTVYEVETIPEDFGRLIGASGRTISALRTLTLAMSFN